MTHGVYRVTGRRLFRGHEFGEEFVAALPVPQERRAIRRGDIELLDRIVPALPASYSFPEGWLSGPTSPNH